MDTDRKTETAIVFTGDIGFDRYMDGKWTDPELLSGEILDFFSGADHVVANVEGALIDAPPGYDPTGRGMFCHSMNPAAVCFLRSIGADIWDLANNHTMDMAEAGMRSALDIAAREGSRTIGAGMNLGQASAPVLLPEAGGVGLMAVGCQPLCVAATETTPGCLPWDDMERIERVIRQIKKTCRWCVVVSHGGEEFSNICFPYVRDRYLKYLEYGADFVVAHHPHITLGYERVGSKIVFYSLGNFIFDTDYQRAQFNTDRGVLLRLNLTPDDWSFDALGMQLDRRTERLGVSSLPDIFTNIPAEEYEKLIPLSAKVFLAAEKKRRIFMDKAKSSYGEAEWRAFFARTDIPRSLPGQYLDYAQITALADREPEGAWRTSNLPKVVDYLLAQLP